jgi:hypothetical protein
MAPIRVLPKQIPPSCFNAVRLALRRRGEPLRLELPGLRAVSCVLARDSWRLVDHSGGSALLLLEWTDFRTGGRGLHEPVPSDLRVFHVQAGLIMGVALEAIERAAETVSAAP